MTQLPTNVDMQIEYVLTAEDYIAKLDKFVGGSRVGKSFTWFAYLTIVALAWTSAMLFYLRQGHQNKAYIVYAALAMFLTISLPWFYRWYQSSFFQSIFTAQASQGLLGKKTLLLFDDHLEERGSKSTLSLQWRNIASIEIDKQRIWLFAAPLIVVVTPITAFANEAEQKRFIDECHERIELSTRSNL